MSVLKKLVCKRVRSDNGDCGESRSYNHDDSWPPREDNASIKAFDIDESQSQMLTTRSSCRNLSWRNSAQETIPANIQHQMEELDAFAKLTDDHFRKSIAITKLEEDQGSVPETADNHDYIVKQILKSLTGRPARDEVGKISSLRGYFLRKQQSRKHFRIGWLRTKNPNNAIPDANNRSRRNGGEKNAELHSKNLNNDISAAKTDTEPACNDTQLYGLHRGKALEQRDDLNGKRDMTDTRPKSLRCIESQTKLNCEVVGAKKTRFADELEQRYFLPSLHDIEKLDDAPSRFFAYIPNDKARKSILRPSIPLNCRYYMSTDTEAKCGHDDSEEVFDWKNEEQASTVASDDQSDMSSALSLDDLSHNSLGSVELLFNLLFCSPVDALSRSDWLR